MTNFGAVSIVEQVVCGKFLVLRKSNFRVRCFQKFTNFGAVSIVERVVWGKSDGNIKDAHGQASHTQIGIRFLAHLSDEKIAFPWEVFLKFY